MEGVTAAAARSKVTPSSLPGKAEAPKDTSAAIWNPKP
jgi:hypothetical protein